MRHEVFTAIRILWHPRRPTLKLPSYISVVFGQYTVTPKLVILIWVLPELRVLFCLVNLIELLPVEWSIPDTCRNDAHIATLKMLPCKAIILEHNGFTTKHRIIIKCHVNLTLDYENISLIVCFNQLPLYDYWQGAQDGTDWWDTVAQTWALPIKNFCDVKILLRDIGTLRHW
jgi:hypothetical protein